MLGFSLVSALFLYALQRLQGGLPLNPAGMKGVRPDLAFNTAVSFVTNTNWQSYSPELTMSYLTQMAGLAVQNFASAAVGMAVAVALVRGFCRSSSAGIGNFWADLVRGTLYVLLPLALVVSVVLLARGVVQTFDGPAHAHTLAGAQQTIARGPFASQEAIKELGTNGGGSYNANSAHPYENPTPFTNLLEIWSLLLIPFAMPFLFGRMLGRAREGIAILAAMLLLLGTAYGISLASETRTTPALTAAGLRHAPNLEGKEQRFSVQEAAIFSDSTTGTSTGAVNSMHDSFTAIGGAVPMTLILLGEVAPGGVGTGLYSILLFATLTVFIAGLMVGRTPEFLGKSIGAREVKLATLGVLVMPVGFLVTVGLSSVLHDGLAGPLNAGPHGFSEILYAFASTWNNNGSAFAGLTAATNYYDYLLGAAMVLGRFLVILPALGARRRAGGPEDAAGLERQHADILADLRRAPDRRDPARRRALLLPRPRPRPPDRGSHREALVTTATTSLLEPAIARAALLDSFRKLDPRALLRNPVILSVWVVSVLVTGQLVVDAVQGSAIAFELQIAIWLWLTVVFANFAEALAEGRGKAQAESLRKTRTTTVARLLGPGDVEEPRPAPDLRAGDRVVCEAGDLIPADGEIIAGIASVDESAVTGESAPVIRESGGDRSGVTGGTRVLSDRIVVRVTANPGETFLDRMIALVEGAERQRTPNEIALSILLAGMSLIFLVVCAALVPMAHLAGAGITLAVLAALFVSLIPTTIGALLSAIGIAGMNRLVRRNVLATSGRAVEAAGDVSVLLLDKTGTITLGNRQAARFLPVPGVSERELAEAAQLSSLPDETPEGRSIVVLAKELFDLRGRDLSAANAHFIAFSAETRMSGVDLDGRALRKGAGDAVRRFVEERGGAVPRELAEIVDGVARSGSTPLVVSEDARVLGVVELKDVVKDGIRARFEQMRQAGIRTVMITGDNPLTAAAIAAEAGVDDYLAEATPEAKLALIRKEQEGGQLIAMTGDGTNDAPALAQADVGVAMNAGTSAAKEAGNMVDLDSNPTKLLDIVEIGKQLLITRGALTTFSISNDLAKYFAIIPAIFVTAYPQLDSLNVLNLHSPHSAILSAIIFNALIIVALVPLALRGVAYRPSSASSLLRRNVAIYGLGGIIVPFIGIKLIDLLITALGA